VRRSGRLQPIHLSLSLLFAETDVPLKCSHCNPKFRSGGSPTLLVTNGSRALRDLYPCVFQPMPALLDSRYQESVRSLIEDCLFPFLGKVSYDLVPARHHCFNFGVG